MESNRAALEQHRAMVAKRTAGSLAVYALFLVTSIISAVQFRPLEDLVTVLAIVFAVAAFLLLPRDYTPTLLQRRATTDEEVALIDRLRRSQTAGLVIRVVYVIGAVLTIVVLPRLASGPGGERWLF